MGRYSANVLVFVSVLSVVLHNAWPCFGQNSMTNCIEKEREALLRLKADLSDQNSSLLSWKGEDCCQWEGVTCDELNGYVVKLQVTTLYGEEKPYPIGELNSTLLNLRYLNHLDLFGIYLKKIPKFFGAMKELKYLILSYTKFHGEVPHQLGNLTKLKVLDIRNDYFIGGFVANIEWVSRLRSLKYLDMGGVNLSRAQHVLQVVSKLPSLSRLSLSECSLSNIHISSHHSANSTSFNHLLHLDISYNFIIGDLGTSIVFQNMTSLVYLDLSGSSFQRSEGALFLFLKNKPYLRSLFLSNSQIKGEELAATFRNFSEFINLEKLDLSCNSIKGVFPNSLAHFMNLKILHLSSCQLIGTIPSSLSWLSSLLELDLSTNQLTGPIPEPLGQLQVLEYLDLGLNYLSGTIPSSFVNLSNLQELSLFDNPLGGLISETHFSNMSKLKRLDISLNHFTFKVETNWTPPFQLTSLEMDSCKLGTTFPKWIQTQVEIEDIGLSNTSIFGDLPGWLANMSFFWMYLSFNQITGPVTNIPIPSTCYGVDISHNNLSGSLPLNISKTLKQVNYLLLSDNQINGMIPSSLCGMQLGVLDLANNKLFGRIPNCWKAPLLSNLRLSFNNLSGFIPSSIGNLNYLEILHLNGNNLNGNLPMSLQNCIYLRLLDVGENNLTGNIPTWLGGSSTNLHILRLRENKFFGSIPSQLCSLSQLQILDLARNNLQGPIPNCFRSESGMPKIGAAYGPSDYVAETMKGRNDNYTLVDLGLLANLDLSSNHLTGLIPQEITLLSKLQGLNLSHNNLFGDIPTKIGDMKLLESLDLSNNHLSGRIPQSISALTWLSHLNLSCNNFTGPIPKGNQIQTLDDPSIYAGNPLLCGDILKNKCPDTKAPPMLKISPDREHGGYQANKLENVLFYIAVMFGFGTGFWGFIGVLVFKKDWRCAYFNLVGRWMDMAYVRFVLMMAKLKRQSRNT